MSRIKLQCLHDLDLIGGAIVYISGFAHSVEKFKFWRITGSLGFGSNIGHGLFVGWVEQPDIFCWVSFLNPTYVPAIFVLSAKPNKMAEDRTISVVWIENSRDKTHNAISVT